MNLSLFGYIFKGRAGIRRGRSNAVSGAGRREVATDGRWRFSDRMLPTGNAM